jgi:hypothetical protein
MQRQQQAGASDGQVDEEHPAPAHSRDQKTAQQRTGGGGGACHGAPQAKGTRALGWQGVRLLEESERARHDQRRAQSLHQAGGDE